MACGCGRGGQDCSKPSAKPQNPSIDSSNSSPLPSTPHSTGKPPSSPPPPPTFNIYTSPLFFSSEPSQTPKLLLSPCLKLNESVAMAKESINPFNDFRESMRQMIDEREIETETELKELLRCFLDINPPSQHNVIVRSFVDICSDLRPPHDRRGKTLGKLLRLYVSPVDESHGGRRSNGE